MTISVTEIVAAARALPDAQRVALMNELARGIEDTACLLPLCRLHGHVGTIIDELERERQVAATSRPTSRL